MSVLESLLKGLPPAERTQLRHAIASSAADPDRTEPDLSRDFRRRRRSARATSPDALRPVDAPPTRFLVARAFADGGRWQATLEEIPGLVVSASTVAALEPAVIEAAAAHEGRRIDEYAVRLVAG